MKPLVHVTGPHTARRSSEGQPRFVWFVRLVNACHKPEGKLYRVMSYRRAVELSCHMARDRRLFLHVEALPS